jgi:hypothetical protein
MTILATPEYGGKLLEPTTRQGYAPRDVAALLNANRPVLLDLEPGDATCYTLVLSEHFYRGAHLLLVARLLASRVRSATWVTVMPPGMPVPRHEVEELCPGDDYTAGVLTWYLSLVTEQLNRPPF